MAVNLFWYAAAESPLFASQWLSPVTTNIKTSPTYILKSFLLPA
jgi:hypothetical protein